MPIPVALRQGRINRVEDQVKANARTVRTDEPENPADERTMHATVRNIVRPDTQPAQTTQKLPEPTPEHVREALDRLPPDIDRTNVYAVADALLDAGLLAGFRWGFAHIDRALMAA